MYLIPVLMPTALLICMENTFWNITTDASESDDSNNFMESLKKSFTLYVESGMEKKIEADIERFRNQVGHLVTEESKAEFCKFINEHYLRKFHSSCLYLHLFHCLCLNAAHPSARSVSAPVLAPPPPTITTFATAAAALDLGPIVTPPNPPPAGASTTTTTTDRNASHFVPHLDTRRSLRFDAISRDLRKFHRFYLHLSHSITTLFA